MSLVACLLYYVPCIMSHVSCLTPPVSHFLFPVLGKRHIVVTRYRFMSIYRCITPVLFPPFFSRRHCCASRVIFFQSRYKYSTLKTCFNANTDVHVVQPQPPSWLSNVFPSPICLWCFKGRDVRGGGTTGHREMGERETGDR